MKKYQILTTQIPREVITNLRKSKIDEYIWNNLLPSKNIQIKWLNKYIKNGNLILERSCTYHNYEFTFTIFLICNTDNDYLLYKLKWL